MTVVQKMSLSDEISTFPDRIDTDRIMRSIFFDPRIDRIVASSASKYGVISDKQELKQSLAIVLYEGYLLPGKPLDFKVPTDVYSLTYAIAENLARTQARQHQKTSIELDDHGKGDADGEGFRENLLMGSPHEEDLVDTGFEDRCIANLDQTAAIKLFSDLMNQEGQAMTATIPGVRLTGTLRVDTKQRRKADKSPNKNIGADHQELRDIRQKLGISLEEMRVQLLIPLSTLQSYVYGKTTSVPDDVMTRARGLLSDEKNQWRMELIKKYDRPMADILADWQRDLGSEGDEFIHDIASYALVNPITVMRWIKDENRPEVEELERCDREIRRVVDARKQRENLTG